MCVDYVGFIPRVYRLGGMCIHHERLDLPSTIKVPNFQATFNATCVDEQVLEIPEVCRR